MKKAMAAPLLKTVLILLLVFFVLAACLSSLALAEPQMDEKQKELNQRAAHAGSLGEYYAVIIEAHEYIASLVQESNDKLEANQGDIDMLNLNIRSILGEMLKFEGSEVHQARYHDLLRLKDEKEAKRLPLEEEKAYREKQLQRVDSILASLGGIRGYGSNAATAYTAGYPAPAPDHRAPEVVKVAYQQLGKPYLHGAAGPNAFDCSGLVMYCYAAVGVSLPHYSYHQTSCGSPVTRQDLQPGDLVFFRKLGHVGIYIGDDQFIHAPHTGDVVRIADLGRRGDFCFACRPGV